jgi:hypothetical protein
MLGGAILLIVVVLFFGIRACTGNKKGNSGDEVEEPVTTNQEDKGNVPSSPTEDGETDDGKKEDANPMEKNNAEVAALITSYYKALGEKDIATLRTLVEDLSPSDESRITNAKDYIDGYEVGDIYTKNGLTEGSYVVYACFDYICKGITTPVPALSQLYVITDDDGQLKIDGNSEQVTEISEYTTSLQKEEDVQQLFSEVKQKNEEAQNSDEELAEFLAGLGEDADIASVEESTIMTVTDGCYVRAEADSEGEILGSLEEGTEVEKLGVSGDWIQIEYDGQTAYVHSSLLE